MIHSASPHSWGQLKFVLFYFVRTDNKRENSLPRAVVLGRPSGSMRPGHALKYTVKQVQQDNI